MLNTVLFILGFLHVMHRAGGKGRLKQLVAFVFTLIKDSSMQEAPND